MLFRTIEEIKAFLPANAAFQMPNITPFIKTSEEKLIVPVLGRTQYDLLDAAYKNNNMDAAMEALLEKARKPVANYAYYEYLPLATVVMSAGGIHVEIDEHKRQLTQWQFLKLEDTFIGRADDGLEELLAFLEEKKDVYTTWKDSDNRKDIRSCFLTSATEFNNQYRIGNSRRTYLAMLPVMKRIQKDAILPILCKDLYDEIIAEVQENDVSTENEALLEFILPAVAYLTIARSLTDLSMKISDDGVRLIATSDRENILVKTPAETARISANEKQARDDGQAYLKRLSNYLYAHADDYTTWKESSCYIDPTSTAAEPFDQSSLGVVSF